MARNWTPEERAKQAEKIRKDKPWEQSTGPRTQQGKTAAAKNALKHGLRSREFNALRRVLNAQRRWLAGKGSDENRR